MVRIGMAMKTGVVTAPTVYDQHPLQYIMRSNSRSFHWNKGVRRGLRIIWKWPCKLRHRSQFEKVADHTFGTGL